MPRPDSAGLPPGAGGETSAPGIQGGDSRDPGLDGGGDIGPDTGGLMGER